jgi:hypothetical protein
MSHATLASILHNVALGIGTVIMVVAGIAGAMRVGCWIFDLAFNRVFIRWVIWNDYLETIRKNAAKRREERCDKWTIEWRWKWPWE